MTQLIPGVNTNDHMRGNPVAWVELVEYGDYECPYCGHAFPIVKKVMKNFGAEIKFVFRNFPLSKIHPHAFAAAMATEAAAQQGRFWEMHDIIFENQKALDDDYIYLFAHRIGLKLDQFRMDMQQKPLIEKVQKDFESGLRSGVNRTPTFFINGHKYEGDWTGDRLFQYLKGLMTWSSTT